MAGLTLGDLRHRITIQRKTRTGTAGAYTAESWETVKTVWAKIEPLASREVVVGDRIEQRNTVRVTIRRRTDVSAAMKIVYQGRDFAISGVRDMEDGGWRWTELSCEEGAPS